jgi:multiple sugar transport system ATP-binding protein
LRALHNRLGATTVYVTHDQLEAMAMADTIAIMNNGVIEQLAGPQDIYDRPASLFVADFVGSPAMNFVPFHQSLARGDASILIDGCAVDVPAVTEDLAESDLVLGVRPEHVRFSDSSLLRGEVFGAEYLGTTQIVTVTTPWGRLKARLPSDAGARLGETIGLDFRPEKLSLFEKTSGRAVKTMLHEAKFVAGARHG